MIALAALPASVQRRVRHKWWGFWQIYAIPNPYGSGRCPCPVDGELYAKAERGLLSRGWEKVEL